MTPELADRPALLRARRRARRAPADFLHEETVTDIQERLDEVNRTFTAPAVVTGHPDLWRAAFPNAVVVADDDLLALEPGAHDLVIHALCMHWAADPVGQLVQCRRALKPDGLFLGVLFGGRSLFELRAALAEAEVAVTGGLSPRILPMGEIRDLGGLLQRAGFALPVADSFIRKVSYRDTLHLMRDLRAMGEGNALAGRRRAFTRRALFAEAEAIYREAFGTEDGRIPATFETIFLTGWAPHESQQKPLKPGSAAARLADALKTDERKLDDPPRGPAD
ncbi:methyltransferase domain-containing protein [Solirhodobacter olei]|uniref:methyltransferase domain-containing protein n=1 Tax=Solirhodobacter olei TaxID=2493082 RepID=UPI000FD9413D|nr:methyltransferase domain-containing protein [Solirhodobacter olei]